ncbi:uncharacterized protein LOC130548853 [Triplophysa rosa]|uniref:uncharacterized protein LOC130548853 n=1 Tax=Triplophysa rosa TaxID=992332 RepID=UPI00254617B2|nr:uncharacterized protein LOC130548853 [Triplophysa rosa]XP_057181867.1 uncharacterized protein LOC130548853 [Triplophysa rosa]
MLTTDSGSATPMPSGSPASSLDSTHLIHSSPAVCPQSPSLHQQLSSESPVVTSSVQPCSADQVMMDTGSQLSLKRLALTIPATEPVSAPDASALHLLSQTAPSRVPTVSQTLPTTAPSVRTGRPAVPLQPITAALTSPYVIQQALFPSVTPHAQPVQPPVTSQWTSALEVSSVFKPRKRFAIRNAFTATGLCLAEHNYPVAALQKAYRHLKDLPLPPVDRVQPLLLIGSDMPHLLTPVQPICQGPIGGPIAIQTSLGWFLQGPMSPMQPSWGFQQCLHMTVPTNDDLIHHAERLWQVETLPYNTKMVTRSKEDKEAYTLLQNATVRVTVDGVQRYATPLLRRNPLSLLNAEKTAVLPSLRSTECMLARDPERTKVCCSEISKLELAGYVAKITAAEADRSAESWFIPHHIVHHNGKDRIVFNCSFQHQGQSLNDQLLPGPNLSILTRCPTEIPPTQCCYQRGHQRYVPPSTLATWGQISAALHLERHVQGCRT